MTSDKASGSDSSDAEQDDGERAALAGRDKVDLTFEQ